MWFQEWRFNEWQSISLYGTDILIFTLFVFAFLNWRRQAPHPELKKIFNELKLSKSIFKNSDFYLFLFLIISVISIKNADDKIIAWFQLFKLVEFSLLYFYLSRYGFLKFGLLNTFIVLTVSSFFQAIIGIWQFIIRSDVGLRYLGESYLDIDLAGVASFYLPTGEKIIRAYGTTPHPNILAAFFLLGIFSFYFAYLISGLGQRLDPIFKKAKSLTLFIYPVVLFALFLTFSRVAILAWLVISAVIFLAVFSKRHKIFIGSFKDDKLLLVIVLTLITVLSFSFIYWDEIISRLAFNFNDQSFELRSFYTREVSQSDIKWLGIGLGNFINWLIGNNPYLLSYAYQPVHNIYLLAYSETGVLGISAFLLFLGFLFKNSLSSKFGFITLFAVCILFMGFFDHMFWTLQQGRIVFWLTLALLTNSSKYDILAEQRR